MSETTIGVYTIGQTPRPDLTQDLAGRLEPWRFEIHGVLDGLTQDLIPECPADGYPLETRLRNGTRVVVDAAFLEPRLQEAISVRDGRTSMHLVLCAGDFPGLRALGPLIQPFRAAVAELTDRGVGSLDVVVPFVAQARPALRKWEASGFSCRAHVLPRMPDDPSLASWLADRVAGTTSEALVFDYVGFPATILRTVADQIDLPVFDVGRLGLDALERELEKGKGSIR
ncbi:MAG: AroM family protein [Gemmatimonadota bacterium]|nr:AroM family protein [Gemmatimonadota bacterium]